MPDTRFNLLPTIVGSMPHTDPDAACRTIARHVGDVPAWPQLPKRSPLENMYIQYSQGFPGAVVEGGKIYVKTRQDLSKPLEELYSAFLEGNVDKYPITPDYAAGFHRFIEMENFSPLAVKGQITGPLTWGMTVTGEDKRAIIYDDVLGDAVPKLLKLKAGWMEKQLKRLSPNTMIFVDEPYMAAFGSVGVMLSPEQVITMMNEVFSGIEGLKGTHCCGNTDWSILLKTKADIISFDAYNYAGSLALYPSQVKGFLERGGAVAWGIVPTDADELKKETAASLKDRLEEAMLPFTHKGISIDTLREQGLVTPSCGLGNIGSEEAAEMALELLSELSRILRKRRA